MLAELSLNRAFYDFIMHKLKTIALNMYLDKVLKTFNKVSLTKRKKRFYQNITVSGKEEENLFCENQANRCFATFHFYCMVATTCL